MMDVLDPTKSTGLENLERRYRALLKVANSIASCRELGELFGRVAGDLERVADFDYLALFLHDEASRTMRCHLIRTVRAPAIDEHDPIEVPVDDSPAGSVFQNQRTLIVTDIETETRFASAMALMRAHGLRSACHLPLSTARRCLGTLAFASRAPHSYTESELELLGEVTRLVAVAVDNALAFETIAQLNRKLAEERLYLENEIRTEHRFEAIVGDSPELLSALDQVETVAPTDSTVLILGETGTGKELIARAIHDRSKRRDRTFVKLNCAAIPSGLLESELFGHEKGAFTGAIGQRIGRFEVANGGTLFLDEVGDIPLELQAKLLRVLQEQEFERIGSTRTIKVDVRIVAATNRDLPAMVERQQFRADLYYRLNVFPIRVPPLRERGGEDIEALVRYFTQHFARRMDKRIETIPADALAAMRRYSWPGNIRELANLIERAVILSRGTALTVPLSELRELRSEAPAGPRLESEGVERKRLLRALDEANWVLGGPRGAAARLGMKRTTLQSRMQRLGIRKPD
jgi:formate hydrogenlyase transcriptional activator